MSKYVKILDDGQRYEWGTIERVIGKPDRLLREGIAPDYKAACDAIGFVPSPPPVPPTR